MTFWESRPKFEKVKDEATEVMVDRVVMDPETHLPVVEKINLGISKICLLPWLKQSPLSPTYDTSKKQSH